MEKKHNGLKSESCSVVSDSLQPHGLEPTRLLYPQNSPGKKNTGVSRHSLLQGMFLTQGSNWSPALQVDSLPAELTW